MTVEVVFYAYVITNGVNGKRYVGITNQVRRRWGMHRSAAAGKEGALYDAMRLYGLDNFTIEVVACARGRANICQVEQALIAQHGTFYGGLKGYNMTLGGDGGRGAACSEDERAARSARAKLMWQDSAYREVMLNAHLGQKRSGETRAKISAKARVRQRTPEEMAALNAAGVKGRQVLAENPEMAERRATANAMRAKPRVPKGPRPSVSVETKARISAALKGVSKTPEHRKKISEAHLRRSATAAFPSAQYTMAIT